MASGEESSSYVSVDSGPARPVQPAWQANHRRQQWPGEQGIRTDDRTDWRNQAFPGASALESDRPALRSAGQGCDGDELATAIPDKETPAQIRTVQSQPRRLGSAQTSRFRRSCCPD